MRFEKWQALGNDYAIVEERELPFELTPERVRAHLRAATPGVGSDGLLLLSETDERGLRGRPARSSTRTAPRPSCRATACARP